MICAVASTSECSNSIHFHPLLRISRSVMPFALFFSNLANIPLSVLCHLLGYPIQRTLNYSSLYYQMIYFLFGIILCVVLLYDYCTLKCIICASPPAKSISCSLAMKSSNFFSSSRMVILFLVLEALTNLNRP